VERIRKSKIIAVDCEGQNLSRRGPLTLLQIQTDDRKIFLFDILAIEHLDKSPLKTLLEDPRILKLVFDFRSDNDALVHQFGISPTMVLDMQLVQYWTENNLSKVGISGLAKWYSAKVQEGPNGWNALHLPPLKKTSFHNSMMFYNWAARPLSQRMLDYAATDVDLIFQKFLQYQSLDTPNFLKYSATYQNFYSQLAQRTFNHWESNGIVPINVFFDQKGMKTCFLCKTSFAEASSTLDNPSLCMRCWLRELEERQRESNLQDEIRAEEDFLEELNLAEMEQYNDDDLETYNNYDPSEEGVYTREDYWPDECYSD